MSILIDGTTKVICQGITGASGSFHTKGCLDYGTQMVGGVTPGKGGQRDVNDLPIFDTVSEAVSATGANLGGATVRGSDVEVRDYDGDLRDAGDAVFIITICYYYFV